MRASHAASGFAIALGALLVVPHAFAHHSFAPHFDASKPVNISGTVTEFEARNPHSYLHIAAVDENGTTREYVCESHGVTQLTRNGITPQMLKAGTKVRVTGSLSRHSPYMCFFDNVEFADGRTLNVNGPTGTAAPPRHRCRRAQGHLRHLAARADTEPQHERPAADDSVPDAGRREGRRRLRSVQGRSDVPLRSGRDPPRLGRARHAARDRARRQRRRAASRMDGRASRRPHEHEGASEGRAAQLARPLDRSLGRRHARDRDRRTIPRAC